MRIAICSALEAAVGGAEVYAHGIAEALARHHAVARVFEHGDPSAERAGARWALSEIGLDAALRELARWEPQVVLCNGMSTPGVERALLERWPVVLFAHDYHGTCASGAKMHRWPRERPCVQPFDWRCAARYYPNGCGPRNPIVALGTVRTQLARRALLPRYAGIVVASRAMAAELGRHGGRSVHLLTHETSPRSSEEPASRPPSSEVLFAGRLVRAKGVHHAIEALARLRRRRELRLIIAGEGPERPKLEALASARGVEVRFLGRLDRAECRRRMREADLLVVPSLWPEPFGLVGIEAAAEGLPSVAYDAGGIREWLVPGVSGELASADPPDPSGLAAAIERATGDHEHWERLRAGAWKAAQGFSQGRHAEELAALLERVVVEAHP